MDINTISVNLAELLTNSVNMTAVFYDIFLNPTPMIIQLQQFDDHNELVTVDIPNRALDRRIAIVGSGSPEGMVPAPIGTAYVNDRDNQLYFKTSGDGDEDPTGWTLVLNQDSIGPVIDDYLNTKDFITRPQLRAYLIQNGYVTRADVSAILEDYVTKVDFTETIRNYVPQTQFATAAMGGIIKIGRGLTIDENGVVTARSGSSRNIGEIVASTVPVVDAALHLLDGSKIIGDGVYSDFVTYMANLYNEGHLHAWVHAGTINGTTFTSKVYTKSDTLTEESELYNSDGAIYSGGLFSIVEQPIGSGNYVVVYNGSEPCSRSEINDIQLNKYFMQANNQEEYNVNIVGSLSATDGILSGFNSTSWANLPEVFSPSSDCWTMRFKFRANGLTAEPQCILNSCDVAWEYVFINLTTTGTLVAGSYSAPSTDLWRINGATVLTLNKDYWVELEYSRVSGYTLRLSEDGVNFRVEGVSAVTTAVPSGYTLTLGGNFSGGSIYYGNSFNGSIDLNDSYININEKRWWSGVEVRPVETVFNQPNMTSNGILGGGTFAVTSIGNMLDNTEPYYAFTIDHDYAYVGGATPSLVFYNPQALKVSYLNIEWSSPSSDYPHTVNLNVYGSNDNTIWVPLVSNVADTSEDALHHAFTSIDISENNNYYKYYKVENTVPFVNPSTGVSYGWLVQYVGISAVYVSSYAIVPDKTAEQLWQESVTKYGVCGKFVYDSDNNTIRLPRINGFVEGTTDKAEIDQLVEAGLPNITGTFSTKYAEGATGAFEGTSVSDNHGFTSVSGNSHQIVDLDASRSNSVYGNSTTVQPQSVKVLYYIVIATSPKLEIEVDIDNIVTELNDIKSKLGESPYSALFDIVPKDHVLDFEESRGLAPLGTYVYRTAVEGARYGYSSFYDKCIEEYSESTSTTETIDGNAVTVYVHSNGHKYYNIADKAAFDSLFADRGEAWYYGIDDERERIFLPRSTRIKFGDTSSAGGYQGAGLPNITGTFGALTSPLSGPPTHSGAFDSYTESGSGVSHNNASHHRAVTYDFNASYSDSIYGGSDTVEYSSTKLIPYMVVGNTVAESAATDIIDVTTTENDTLPLFTGMYFDVTPNNASWVLAGGQVVNGEIYAFAYNELVNELTTPKYNILVIKEEDMEPEGNYDLYWIVNETNQTFRCPLKLSYGAYKLGGTIPVKGNGKTLGLTDGSANYGIAPQAIYWGIYATESVYNANVGTGSSGYKSTNSSLGVTTDASKSGLVAELGNASSATTRLYFKVANAVQNIEVLDAGEVLEAVNDIIPDNSSLIAEYGMPSNIYEDLVFGDDGATYTAPANGYLYVYCTTSGSGYVSLGRITPNDFGFVSWTPSSQGVSNFLPVHRGDTVKLTYRNIASTTCFRFIYAKGSEGEAN